MLVHSAMKVTVVVISVAHQSFGQDFAFRGFSTLRVDAH